MTKGANRAWPSQPHGLYSRVRTMLPEILKFWLVGGLGTVIDLGGAAVLHGTYHFEPLAAKAVSVTLATVFTYLGSRFWTFKERENQAVRREVVLFFVLNVVGLLIAEAVIGLVTYVMGLRGPLAYNAASFIGTGLGTIFRFWAYRKWVFLAPEDASASPPLPNAPGFPDYPPWELDPRLPRAGEAAAQAPLPAPSYSSPWERRTRGYLGPGARAIPLGRPCSPACCLPPDRHTTGAGISPAQAVSAPVQDNRPRPSASAARRPSGGGRHRKS